MRYKEEDVAAIKTGVLSIHRNTSMVINTLKMDRHDMFAFIYYR